MLSLALQRFPEAYTGGRAPAALGTRDEERKSGTPCYLYGWVMSRIELYEVLNGEPPPRDYLPYIHLAADTHLYNLWTEKGYLDNEYNPPSPAVRQLGPKHVVILMACNDSDAIIKSIMENKTYHANCRAGLGNPKVLEEEPAWFRVGLKDLPKVFSDPTTVDSVVVFQRFPDVYTGGRAPAALGTRDEERKSGTPCYLYGWVMSRIELYEVLNGEPPPRDSLPYIHLAADTHLYNLWTEKGYLDNEYNPPSPAVRQLGPKHVVILLSCNDSDAIIKSIMENKTYHANCRAGLGNPKVIEEEPAWFRVGLKDRPKVVSDTSAAAGVDQ